MLAERVEVRVEARQRDRGGLQAAVVGHGEQRAAAALEHAAHLEQRVADVRDVLEHLRAPDEVDLAVAERERAVGLEQADVGAGTFARARSAAASAISTPTGSAPASRSAREEAARAAAEVEHPLAGL